MQRQVEPAGSGDSESSAENRRTSARAQGVPARNAGTSHTRLSRDVVLHAALDLVDADGLDALSMRRLGNKLGKDPMALYRHAANRDALLDGLTELVLDQWSIPAADSSSELWQEQLREAAHNFRALALEHPRLVPLLVTRPLSTPMGLRPLGALRPVEQLLAVLSAAGFSPAGSLHAYRTYYGFLIGHVINELEEFVVNPDEDDTGLRLGLHRLPKKDFPHVRALATVLEDYDGQAELDQGITVILQGLQAQLHSPTPP